MSIREALLAFFTDDPVNWLKWAVVFAVLIGGWEGRYTAYFKHPATPPAVLYLYYVSDPKRLFSCDEYHYGAHKGLLLLLIVLLPFLLACAALYLLGVERPAA